MSDNCNSGWGWSIFNRKSLKGHESKLGHTHCDLKKANEMFDQYAKHYRIELIDNKTGKVIRKN